MPDVYVQLTDNAYHRSVVHGGYTVDYDDAGNVTGVEVLGALSVDIDGKPVHIRVSDGDAP